MSCTCSLEARQAGSHCHMGYSGYTNRLSPIVSFVASPAYQLSTFLSGVLVVGQTSSYVKNSKSFAEFIATQALTKEEILISFEVLSLFTCIPTWPGCPGSLSGARRGPIPPRKNEPVGRQHCGPVNPVPGCLLSVI